MGRGRGSRDLLISEPPSNPERLNRVEITMKAPLATPRLLQNAPLNAAALPCLSPLVLGQTTTGPATLGVFANEAEARGITSTRAAFRAHWIDYDLDGRLDLHLESSGESTLDHALETENSGLVLVPVNLQ